MSFILKGGYDAFGRNIINVSLRKTTIWNRGAVRVNGAEFNIDSSRDNLIEMVKYDDIHTLLVNNAIIYDNRKMFVYDIDLKYNLEQPHDFSKKNIYNYINYNIINYNEIQNIFAQRTLN
jgi:hypothetical protein